MAPTSRKIDLLIYIGLLVVFGSLAGGLVSYMVAKDLTIDIQEKTIQRLGVVTTTGTFPAALNNFQDNDIINSGDWNNIEYAIGETGTTSPKTLTYQVTNTNANNISYTGRLTITNASTTNFSIGSTGSFNLNATGTMQGYAFCTSGNAACGTVLTIGGSNTQVQFNDSSVLGGDADFVWDKTLNKLTFVNASTTNLTVSGASFFATATSTSLYVSGGTQLGALNVVNNTNLGNATTTGLTVQGGTKLGSLDIAALNTASVITNANLANSTISGISLGSNLADLTATNGTLTFSGTYTGATARTIGLNLGNINSWPGGQTFLNATSTASLFIPFTAGAFTLSAEGQIRFNTTPASSSIQWFDNTAQRAIYDLRPRSIPIASSTWASIGGSAGTSTILFSIVLRAETWTNISCATDTGTAWVRFGDGTNWMSYIPVDSGNPADNTVVSSNNTFTIYELQKYQVWGFDSSPNTITCSVNARQNAE